MELEGRKRRGELQWVIRLRIKLPDISLFPGSQNATGGGFSVSHAIGRPRRSTDDIRMNSLAGETRKYIPRFLPVALALGDREQKEGANNHCSGEQSGSKTPAVAIGSALGEPRPIDREMRRHKRDEAVGYPVWRAPHS